MKKRGTYFTPTLTAIAGMVGDPNPILDKRGRDYVPIHQRAVLAAHQMGVPIAAGTDSSGGVIEPIGREVELMHQAGLSTLDAIRTATTNAATLLGLEKTVGRLQPGFSGDVLVVAGDPLTDITVLKKPEGGAGRRRGLDGRHDVTDHPCRLASASADDVLDLADTVERQGERVTLTQPVPGLHAAAPG
jgi:hypothetical protein